MIAMIAVSEIDMNVTSMISAFCFFYYKNIVDS